MADHGDRIRSKVTVYHWHRYRHVKAQMPRIYRNGGLSPGLAKRDGKAVLCAKYRY